MSKKKDESVPFELEGSQDIPDHVALVGEGHNLARRILRSWAHYLPDDGEHNTAPSQTMPNQSLSVREIFKRFASGQPLSPRSDMVFTGDDPSPDLRQFDIEEIHEMQRANAENLERMRVALKAKSDERRQVLMREELAKQEAAKQADINAAVQAAVEDKTKKS